MAAPPKYDDAVKVPPEQGIPAQYPGQAPGYPPQGAPPQPYPPQAAPGQQPYPVQPVGVQPGYPAPPGQPGYAPVPQQIQQPGYPPTGFQQQPGQTTVIVQPAAVVVSRMGEVPVATHCNSCRQQVTTRVHYESGTLTWLACAGLCIVGCNLGCCLIPFCVDGLQDAVHTCPNCNNLMGRYNRM